MIIVDAHQDIADNFQVWGRDYRQSALKNRRVEDNSRQAISVRGIAANGLPEALIGRVAVIFATLFACPALSKFAVPPNVYHDAQEAYKIASAQLDYYHRLTDEDPRVRLIRTRSDLDAVLETWGPDKSVADHQVGLTILMEGADPILEPRQLEEWYERGLRIIGPAWSETRYAGGTGRPGPLTDLGRELLDVMGNYHMLLDLSHLTEQGYMEAVDRYEGPMIASHSNPRHFVDRDRMLSDEQIWRLVERDGVIGVVLFNLFIKKGWTLTDRKSDVGMQDVIGIIDYICQLTGSSRYVGIGSDVDGGFGSEAMPAEIDTTADIIKIADALAEHGYSEDDISNIMGQNFLRKLREGLPA